MRPNLTCLPSRVPRPGNSLPRRQLQAPCARATPAGGIWSAMDGGPASPRGAVRPSLPEVPCVCGVPLAPRPTSLQTWPPVPPGKTRFPGSEDGARDEGQPFPGSGQVAGWRAGLAGGSAGGGRWPSPARHRRGGGNAGHGQRGAAGRGGADQLRKDGWRPRPWAKGRPSGQPLVPTWTRWPGPWVCPQMSEHLGEGEPCCQASPPQPVHHGR